MIWILSRLQLAEDLLLKCLHQVVERVDLHCLHLDRILHVLLLIKPLRLVVEVEVGHRLSSPSFGRNGGTLTGRTALWLGLCLLLGLDRPILNESLII